jgi:ribulose-phosphate 3-epimerase
MQDSARSSKISVSLLAADFGRLAYSALLAEASGADSIHMDVVDGHFALNFAFGPSAVAAVRRVTDLPLIVHLEVDCPGDFLEPFADAGADTILFQPEVLDEPERVVEEIHRLGKRAGLSLLSSTSVSSVRRAVHWVDTLLFLGVPPGFGGGRLDTGVYEKVRQARELARQMQKDIETVVDGGVDVENAPALAAAGVDVFVSGTYIFGGPGPRERIGALRRAIETVQVSCPRDVG